MQPQRAAPSGRHQRGEATFETLLVTIGAIVPCMHPLQLALSTTAHEIALLQATVNADTLLRRHAGGLML